MERSDWSRHILEFGTTRCAQCYQTPFSRAFRGLGHETRIMYEYIYIVWRVIFVGANFRGKSERPSKLIFVVLNFVTATSPGAWHCCTSDDVIDTRVRDLVCNTKPYLRKIA